MSDIRSERLADCVRTSLPEPWRLARADAVSATLEIEARAAELQIEHGDYPAAEQQQLRLTVGPLRGFQVIDPNNFRQLVDAEVLQPVSADDAPNKQDFAPFELYTSGTGLLFVNLTGGEFCVRRETPPEWPNPFVRCQFVRGRYSAAAIFSARATPSLPRIASVLRGLLDTIVPCLEASQN